MILTFQNAGAVPLSVPVEPRTDYYSTLSLPAYSSSPSKQAKPGATSSATASPAPGASAQPSASPIRHAVTGPGPVCGGR